MKRNVAPRIFRVLVQAKDLDQSERFYEALLGTRGRRVAGGRIYFDCGPVILGILDSASEGRDPPRPPTEALYFASADLEGVYRRARALGSLSAELIHNDVDNPAGEIVVRPWGERSFYVIDPSGNPLCFVDDHTLFTGTARQIDALRRGSHGRSPGARRTHRSGAQPRRGTHRRSTSE